MFLPAAPGLETEVAGSLLSMPALGFTCTASGRLGMVHGRPGPTGHCRAATSVCCQYLESPYQLPVRMARAAAAELPREPAPRLSNVSKLAYTRQRQSPGSSPVLWQQALGRLPGVAEGALDRALQPDLTEPWQGIMHRCTCPHSLQSISEPLSGCIRATGKWLHQGHWKETEGPPAI